MASSDGVLALSIPAGAVNGNVTVTVTPAVQAGSVGTAYEIGPTGTVFNFPVTMTFHYASANIGSASPSSLRAATYGSSAWQILAGGAVDTSAKTVSGTTMHLSTYGEILVSSGEVCAQVTSGGSSCSGTLTPNDGGSAPSGTSSNAGGGSGGSGFAPEDCPSAPTCATATNICAGYPGATMTGCTDGPNGYTASCCFAPNAPVCFDASNAAACLSAPSGGTGAGSSGGSGGTGACPTPTCATAGSPCGNLPGATFSNCTDTTDGYSGSCCFAPGTPVCMSGGEALACTSTAGGSGTGGSSSSSGGTTSCGTAPTCSDGSACSQFVGATTQSCTNIAAGYNATCCMPIGVLPSASSGSTSSNGGSGTSTSPSGGSGGTSSGGSSGSGFDDASAPIITGGDDAGAAPPADASVACKFTLLPTTAGSCGVQENCPASGMSYQMLCTEDDGDTSASCTCKQNGLQTTTTTQDCSTFTTSSITECGYPGP